MRPARTAAVGLLLLLPGGGCLTAPPRWDRSEHLQATALTEEDVAALAEVLCRGDPPAQQEAAARLQAAPGDPVGGLLPFCQDPGAPDSLCVAGWVDRLEGPERLPPDVRFWLRVRQFRSGDRLSRMRAHGDLLALGPEALPLAAKALPEAEPDLARMLVRLARDLGGREAQAVLDAAASHRDPTVRQQARDRGGTR